jgi:hypothetical protein
MISVLRLVFALGSILSTRRRALNRGSYRKRPPSALAKVAIDSDNAVDSVIGVTDRTSAREGPTDQETSLITTPNLV